MFPSRAKRLLPSALASCLWTLSLFPILSQARLITRDLNTSLLILPLGDSITYGIDSTNGNGYRLDLSTLLAPTTNVTYIGSVAQGTMANNLNEGHPGFTIDQISAVVSDHPEDFAANPNMVLLMAGTNDVLIELDLPTAPARLSTLIDRVITLAPSAAILVAAITPLVNTTANSLREDFNSQIPAIVGNYSAAGHRVAMVNMANVTISELDSADGIHPDDAGYATMAQTWYQGILEANANGWIAVASNASNATVIDAFSSAASNTPTLIAAQTTTAPSPSVSVSVTKKSGAVGLRAELGLLCGALLTTVGAAAVLFL